jgi:hypothetical protein
VLFSVWRVLLNALFLHTVTAENIDRKIGEISEGKKMKIMRRRERMEW